MPAKPHTEAFAESAFEANLSTRRNFAADTSRRDNRCNLGLRNCRTAKSGLWNAPPSNHSEWFRKDDDPDWQFGVPLKGNANLVRVQYVIHHFLPALPGASCGMAGFVLANGSRSSD